MKICIIAQVENWRGGIQQYSQNYAEALATKASTCVVGYKSYFPLWLYPGDTTNIKNQHRKWKEKVPVFNVLKYYSLLSVYKAYRIISKHEKADVADLQWCTTFHAPILIPLVLLLRFFSKTSVFITVHNVLPHENRFFDKVLCKIIYRLADKLVVHSQKMKQDLLDIFHIKPDKVSIIPHGICSDYKHTISNQQAKDKLGIKEKTVLLFFGLVRRYKGLENLLKAFSQVHEKFDVALLIAGDFVEGKEKYETFIRDNNLSSKTYIHAGYIKDEDVPLFFSASDILVQPYLSFSGQSGVPPTAYYYSKPVIASKVGGLPEIVINNKTGLVIDSNTDELTNALSYLLNNPDKIEEFGNNGKEFLENELSWNNIAHLMLNNYSDTVNQ